MPKDNEVDEKVVAWLIRYSDVLDGSPRQTVYTHNTIADWRTIDPGATSEPLYSAATVAELRARLLTEVELHGRNIIEMARKRNAESDRADAAERRVADVAWRMENEATQFIDEKGQIYLRYLIDILTGAPA